MSILVHFNYTMNSSLLQFLYIFIGSCNLSKMATTNTSVSLRWSRPAAVTGNSYVIYVHDGISVRSLMVTDSAETVDYIIPNLKPFTSYTVNVTIDNSNCSVTFRTSEGGKNFFFYEIF